MPEISIKAEELFHIGSFHVTNSLLLAVITAGLLIIIAVLLRRKIDLIPSKLQGIFELIVEAALDLMDAILGAREKSIKYLPLVGSIFLFVLFSNWLGLMPWNTAIGVHHTVSGEHGTHEVLVPLFRAPTADLNTTLALAMIAVLGVNLLAFIALGFKRHAGKFFHFKNPIMTFVGLLELVSEFVKIISFSFRLFGNIFAGEVLLLIVGFLVPYVVPLPFLFLEVFVGFIQAFIFSMLTLVFIAMATSEHEEAH